MDKYLYLVELYRGRANKNYKAFVTNASTYYGKAPDYGGINNICVLAHSQDDQTVHLLMSDGFKGDGTDLTVTEITSVTLADPTGKHRLFTDTVEYFKKFNNLPNL